MVQTGYLGSEEELSPPKFLFLTEKIIENLNVDQARKEEKPFVKNPEALTVWSEALFKDEVQRIVMV